MKKAALIVVLFLNTFHNTEVLAIPAFRTPIVFIAGYDEGNNTYYTNAKQHFSQSGYLVVEHLYSLAEILEWMKLHYDRNVHGDIHIVSHSNPWRGLSMKTTANGERISEAILEKAIADNSLYPLDKDILADDTKLIFHACGLGQNKSLLALLKNALTQNDSISVYASELYNVFGGKYADHYLANTYYGYYPTSLSPGPRQLAKEFRAKYPHVNADWEQVLKTRTEQLSGDLYTYKFNIPIEWEFEFEDQNDIPEFTSRQDIIDWIMAIDELKHAVEAFQIPMKKFRWLAKTHGNSLTIKGKTTVLCILQPVMQPENPKRYLPVDIESRHYVKL